MGNETSRPKPDFPDNKYIIKWENKDCCNYSKQCKEFFDSLNINKQYLNPKKDFCFCSECRKKDKKPNTVVFERGVPPESYILPIGWSRFGILGACTNDELDVYYETGHIAYHGTYSSTIRLIVEDGKLIPPGSQRKDGSKIEVRDGHIASQDLFKDESGTHEPHIFMTPSIKYASYKNFYAVDKSFQLKNGQTKTFKCCLEIRILPGKYGKFKETVLESDQRKNGFIIDQHVSNKEIEWHTNENDVHIVTGVMIKMT